MSEEDDDFRRFPLALRHIDTQLAELASKQWQEREWFAGGTTSPDETVNMLFDVGLERYAEFCRAYCAELAEMCERLVRGLTTYPGAHGRPMDAAAMIDDPRWETIRLLASAIRNHTAHRDILMRFEDISLPKPH